MSSLVINIKTMKEYVFCENWYNLLTMLSHRSLPLYWVVGNKGYKPKMYVFEEELPDVCKCFL